jgi:hypothetical protein
MRRVVVLMCGVLVVAFAAQAAPASESKSMTIRLVSITTRYKVLKDVAPKNEFNKGDVLWARSTLRNEVAQFVRPKGAVVGSDISTFRAVSAVAGDMRVIATLPGGTLRAAGRISQGHLQRVAVLGGTGVFAGARGVAVTTPLDASGDRARNVYRLQLP